MDKQTRLSAESAVKRGHLVITLPVCLLIFGVTIAVGLLIKAPPDAAPVTLANLVRSFRALIGLLIGTALGWLWWSSGVPRWREWAHENGADDEETQQLAERSLLVWPKGSIFEKTEFQPRHKR